jgi:hypothetical protein
MRRTTRTVAAPRSSWRAPRVSVASTSASSFQAGEAVVEPQRQAGGDPLALVRQAAALADDLDSAVGGDLLAARTQRDLARRRD